MAAGALPLTGSTPSPTYPGFSKLRRIHRLKGRLVRPFRSCSVHPMHAFAVREVARKLRAAGGGYEIVHESAGTEIGVYVLVAPEPDRQQPHEDDEVYVVLEGPVSSRSRARASRSRRAPPSSSRRAPTIASLRTSSSRCS